MVEMIFVVHIIDLCIFVINIVFPSWLEHSEG